MRQEAPEGRLWAWPQQHGAQGGVPAASPENGLSALLRAPPSFWLSKPRALSLRRMGR